ncbi:MAG: nuclear transport factor 2 family protein [Crinalium sp.]
MTSEKVAEKQDNQATDEYSEQVKTVGKIAEAVVQANWEEVQRHLTDDVFYKVGSREPVHGKQAVIDFFTSLYSTTAKFKGHQIRKLWDEPGIVAAEMDAYYLRLKDNQQVTIACCDIYRIRDNKVYEGRVYVDGSLIFE